MTTSFSPKLRNIKVLDGNVDLANYNDDILKILEIIRPDWKPEDVTYKVNINDMLYL